MYCFWSADFIINGVLAAAGDTLFDMYSLAVCMSCVDEVGKIPWVMIHFRKYKWVKNLTR